MVIMEEPNSMVVMEEPNSMVVMEEPNSMVVMEEPNSMVVMEEPNIANSFPTDIDLILSNFKHKQKQIQHKRRWLLGLSTSEEELHNSKKLKFLDTSSLPESFLREDDIFYETVKSSVQEAFGVHCKTGQQAVLDDLQLLGVFDIPRAILSCIDNLTTKGLYLLAKTLTRGQMGCEKTRPKMKKIVRQSLSIVFRSLNPNHHHDHHLMELCRQITQLLYDPRNFQDNYVPFFINRLAIKRAAVKKVLAELRNFPQQTLDAMHKKLRGAKLRIPQLQQKKNGRGKDYLISRVRKNSKQMLSEFEKGGDLPEPLAKTMAIADLSLKLTPGFHNASVMEFYKFSQEIELLQGEITKAIWLLKTKVGLEELKSVKKLLAPDAKVPIRSLRSAIRQMLTDYLFVCGDMDTVPKSLIETLAVINKNQSVPDKSDLKYAIEDEMECILNLSAHTKQVLLDLLPADDFDVDFTDAYMEDLEESDDDEFCYVNEDCDMDEERELDDNISQNSICHSVGSNQEVESTADSNMKRPTAASTSEDDPCNLTPDKKSNNAFGNGLESKIPTGLDTANFSFNKHTTSENRYLAIQEACDETSVVAYNLIGHVLEELGRNEGLDLDSNCIYSLRGDCGNNGEIIQGLKTMKKLIKKKRETKESDGMTLFE